MISFHRSWIGVRVIPSACCVHAHRPNLFSVNACSARCLFHLRRFGVYIQRHLVCCSCGGLFGVFVIEFGPRSQRLERVMSVNFLLSRPILHLLSLISADEGTVAGKHLAFVWCPYSRDVADVEIVASSVTGTFCRCKLEVSTSSTTPEPHDFVKRRFNAHGLEFV